MPRNRILIGLPLYGSVGPTFLQHWLKFQAGAAAVCKGGQVPIITTNMAYVSHAQTAIVDSALQSPEWDYLIFVEHDNLVPEDWARVVAEELDPEQHHIVGRWYFGRAQDDMRPVCGFLRENGDFDRLSYDQVKDYRANAGLHLAGPEDNALTYIVGMGCTAVHRTVFEQWKGPRPWFQNVESERGFLGHDVHFCMKAHEQGYKVWLDTRQAAKHIGEFQSDEDTYCATAEHMDRQMVESGNIVTAMADVELAALRELARGKKVLEIGSRLGASTIGMAQTAHKVYAVDWHQGDRWHDAAGGAGLDTLAVFWGFVRQYKMRDKIHPLVGRSEEILPVLAPAQFDMVFIDGDHSYQGVLLDIGLSLPLLKPGGLLVFHDYKREEAPGSEHLTGELEVGITKAVRELFGEPDEIVGTLAVVRSPLLVPIHA